MDVYPPDLPEHPAHGLARPRQPFRLQSEIMNDAASSSASGPAPAGAARSLGNGSASLDPDTCRICRGEATADEPLFYPCKCSGSIKYVHQDCLMEWLSHSQKKHCELCKTPFRFTKLYSPNMPKHLPFHIFVSHMAKYFLRNVMVWCRAGLVACVWLGCLPYLMRLVWSSLFWLSDEGFSTGSSVPAGRNPDAFNGARDLTSLSLVSTPTCPSTPLLATAATATSAARIGGIEHPSLLNLSTWIQAMSQPLNRTANTSLLRMLLGSGAKVENPASAMTELNLAQLDVAVAPAVRHSHHSLFSDVGFLNNLTRNPVINRAIIRILEGQVITLLVIICFILIILVRDYVVQQQPEINMRAAFAAADNEPPLPLQGFDDPLGAPESEDEDTEDAGTNSDSGESSAPVPTGDPVHPEPAAGEADRADQQRLALRPVASFRRRSGRQDLAAEEQPSTSIGEANQLGEQPSASSAPANGISAPDRSQNNERDSFTFFNAAKEYSRIHRAAGGDREKIFRAIRDEGLEDRLGHLVRVLDSVENNSRGGGGPIFSNNDNAEIPGPSAPHSNDEVSPDKPHSPTASAINRQDSDALSWTLYEEDETAEGAKHPDEGKGKAPERPLTDETKSHGNASLAPLGPEVGTRYPEASQPPGDEISSSPKVIRPRAVSDGPQLSEPINPLANNSWSFSGLTEPGPSSTQASAKPEPEEASLTGLFASSVGAQLHHESDTPVAVVGNGEATSPRSQSTPPVAAATEPQSENGPLREDRVEPPSHPESAVQAAVPVAQQPVGIVDRVADFMWGDMNAGPGDDLDAEEPVDIFGDNQNAPFMDDGRDENEDGIHEDDLEVAPDVMEAAAAAGLDPEAIEDAEDFEGIMELIGMRGPIAGLFQNAVFCAFLVSITLFLGIFVPYNIGRLAVWFIANPTRVVHMMFSFARFVQDCCMLLAGYTSSFVFNLAEALRLLFRVQLGKQALQRLRATAMHVAVEAFDRITVSFMSDIPLISSTEMRNFSAVSHGALLVLKSKIYDSATAIGQIFVYAFGGDYGPKFAAARDLFLTAAPAIIDVVKSAPGVLLHPGSWMISLHFPDQVPMVNPNLAYWDANDRTWAILLGYVAISVLAGLYLARGTPFSTTQTGQEWEASLIDALNQASGVMKVILIISIEMLIFPLYCGLLLDFALLPLFESTSLKSRLLFTYNYPLTSMFVHWFVGTGYMFHFALFVSMCRKIMRKGVLYFIRDPDDPEFHPVRDVLERNVTTQLRKILFSAFVYGALVVVCLGGVVWGLSLALANVLPIHYSSNEPVLEFPIDLLFYNFLMPLAVRFFKPSDGLHAMYTWWFRKCARTLRLTWFLFGERRVDEEGQLVLPEDSPHRKKPWWRTMFLQIDSHSTVVPKTWQDTFEGGHAKPVTNIPTADMTVYNVSKAHLVDTGQLIPDGRFVRSPASDQVKIPKGQPVFLNVTERDVRRDGKPDQPETDLYSSTHYQFVYLPPWFRVRVFLFILSIWIFAAVTGVGFTIVPLVFGRRMFKILIPSHIRTNDIYAFSIGIYVLGSIGYFIFHLQETVQRLKSLGASAARSMFDRHAIRRVLHLAQRALQLVYSYTVLILVFPLLITLLVELYVLMPLHTYMYPGGGGLVVRGGSSGHTIRVIQAWTLGILYLKLGSRALTLYGGRPAQAVRAVLRRGWLHPDVSVLTRAFVIPGVLASLALILCPPLVARAVIRRCFETSAFSQEQLTHEMQVFIYRLAYPLTALIWASLLFTRRMVRIFQGWQVRIRDEAYLMGERLHNFGGTAAKAGVWRGGTRL
ncbi:hypothetical protein F4780DRAFT_773816 [Xylariomycetidae sp. FL0641]|nr:hypothetical protein F4780DRAFT_773816 [Xylariomycetidae sp. FL0641]